MSKLLKQAAAIVENAAVSVETVEAQATVSYYWVPENEVLDNPFQYRQIYDPTKLIELAENIYRMKTDLPTLGLEQIPYARLVRQVNGDYVPLLREDVATHEQILYWLRQGDVRAELMFGHRRRRAWTVIRHGIVEGFGRLGLKLPAEFMTPLVDGDPDYASMPMHIGYADDPQMWRHAVSENRHRSDVTAIEEAESMSMAKSAFGYSDEQIGKIFGYARSTVANKQRLLKLPDGVRQMLLDGQLTERHGRELARLAEYPTEAIEAAKTAINDNASPDMLERSVERRLKDIEEKRQKRAQVAAAEAAIKTYCLPGQTEPVGAMPVRQNVSHWDYEVFETNSSAEVGLLKTGMCGKHCECFCLMHYPYEKREALKPDPEHAPNVVIACSSRQRHNNQIKRWQKQYAAGAELTPVERERAETESNHRRVKDQMNEAGQQLIDETLASLNLRTLWGSVEFWKIISGQNMPEQFTKQIEKCKSINEVAEVYLRWLCDRTGRQWTSEARDTVYDVGKLRKCLNPLRALAGVSVETVQPFECDAEPLPKL